MSSLVLKTGSFKRARINSSIFSEGTYCTDHNRIHVKSQFIFMNVEYKLTYFLSFEKVFRFYPTYEFRASFVWLLDLRSLSFWKYFKISLVKTVLGIFCINNEIQSKTKDFSFLSPLVVKSASRPNTTSGSSSSVLKCLTPGTFFIKFLKSNFETPVDRSSWRYVENSFASFFFLSCSSFYHVPYFW